MSKVSPLVDGLIEAMQCLPGVGPKSAQRMVLHLLERNRIKYLFDEIYLKSLPRDPSRGNLLLSQFVGKIKKF